jgi:hypothetical protein
MSADPTARARVERYTAKMRARGACHVRVWVPSEADAEEIRRRAEEMREQAAAREKQTP